MRTSRYPRGAKTMIVTPRASKRIEMVPQTGLVLKPNGAPRSLKQRLWANRWGLAVTLVTLISSLGIYAVTPISWTPGSDGFYSWTYARSLAFDGDIDFKNDYSLCGDPFRIGVDRALGIRTTSTTSVRRSSGRRCCGSSASCSEACRRRPHAAILSPPSLWASLP